MIIPIFNSIHWGIIWGRGRIEKYILNAQKYLLNFFLPISATLSILHTKQKLHKTLVSVSHAGPSKFCTTWYLPACCFTQVDGSSFLLSSFVLFCFLLPVVICLSDRKKEKLCIYSYALITFVSIAYEGKYQITLEKNPWTY